MSEQGRFNRGGRGGRGGHFDFSSMSPEERQRMMDRGMQFMRGMGGGQNDPNDPNAVDDPNDPNDPLESLNLNNVEMRNLMKTIGDWTGKTVIPSSDEIMQAKITVYSPQKLKRSQALSLIYMALQSRGVAVDQTAERIILRPLLSAKLGAIPTLSADEPLARVQDKTSIVEKWFQMSNYSPTSLVEMIKPLVGEHGYAMADESSGRVGVIDTVENLMRIEKIVQELDVPESSQTIEQVFEIKYGDPAEIVSVMELILSDEAKKNIKPTTPSGDGSPQGNRPGAAPAKQTPMSSVVIPGTASPIRLIPVSKQRWIIARANREDMKRVAEWIEKLDLSEIASPQQSVVPVVYASPSEVVNMINRTLRNMPAVSGRAPVVVEALEASKQIVVFGDEDGRTMVEKMIAQIDLPSGDYFQERTFKLKHADPDQIKKNIDGLFSQTSTSSSRSFYGFSSYDSRGSRMDPKNEVKVISYPTMKQVTVIASEQNMQKIARQIEEEWDIPLDIQKDQYRILALQNSDPVKMSDLLTKLFSESSANGSADFFRMMFGEETASKQKIVGSLYGMLTFEPVPDTKKLIVISKIPEAYDVIERLVAKLDGQEEGEVPRVIVLKYADCESLCDQLNSIFNEAGTPTSIPRSARGLSSYDPAAGATKATAEDTSGQITPWWTRQRQDTTQLPASNLIGKVRFVPVQRSKSVLVLGPVEYIDDLAKMIETLDQPGMQVMVKASIVEINLQDLSSLGVKLASDPSAFGASDVGSVEFLSQLTNVERGAIGSTTPTPVETTTLQTSVNIYALVDLLVKKANGRVLNQPTLWTKDNEEAVFVKGQKIAFLKSDQTDSSNLDSVSRSYDYEDVGVTLRVRPNITPEKSVDMTINLNISQIESQLINGQNTRKNLDTTTHSIVSDGQTLMLGGILYQNDDKVVHKIPLLGDLPLIGAAFRHNRDELTNSELLVFVTPYVFDETMRVKAAVEKNHQQVLEEALQKKERMINDLAETMREVWGDPNQPSQK
jgi:general secretion pathway protein D